MGQRIYIQLARTGDILNILPLAHADAQVGDRSAIMVCKDFAPILDGCSYVDRVIFDGTPWELDKAVAAAEKMTDRVVNVQLAGPHEVVKNVVTKRNGMEYRTVTESFLKDQWKLADRLQDWKKQLPLVFDQRDKNREEVLIDKYIKPHKARPMVWVATSGVSSPFPYTKLLNELIRLRFGRNYNIVDISDLKAERIFDLIGLFEHPRTHCLVATDSAPLHLAYACPRLPVVALTNDKPSLWHGSCWRPNHVCHIRYSKFPETVDILEDMAHIYHPGCFFNPKLKSPKIIHVWSGYEEGYRREDWKEVYLTDHWVATPVRYGTVGRDSVTQLKDHRCFPFLKDVIRIATLRADTNDIICLSRADVVPKSADRLTQIILNATTPLYFRRSRAGMHHPAVDMFSFTKAWWQAHQNDLPDFVLGKDSHWHRVLAEFMRLDGGQEVEFAIEKRQ